MSKFPCSVILNIIFLVWLSKRVNAATEQHQITMLPPNTVKIILSYLHIDDYFHFTLLKRVLYQRHFAHNNDMVQEMFRRYQQWVTNPDILPPVSRLNCYSSFLREQNLIPNDASSILFTSDTSSSEFLHWPANINTEIVKYCQSNRAFIGYQEIMRITRHKPSETKTYATKNNHAPEKAMLPLVYDWYNKTLRLYDESGSVILHAYVRIPSIIIFTDESKTPLYKVQVFNSRSKYLISTASTFLYISYHGTYKFSMSFNHGSLDKLSAEINKNRIETKSFNQETSEVITRTSKLGLELMVKGAQMHAHAEEFFPPPFVPRSETDDRGNTDIHYVYVYYQFP